jgi:sigma54-dependent transcription regulator
VTVQGAFVEENAKVLKNGRELAGLYGHMLESFNGIWRSKDSLTIR